MPLTTDSLKPKPKPKLPPKKQEKALSPLEDDRRESAGDEIEDAKPAVPPDGDVHHIPERDYAIYRPHDAVRGCWCFPAIDGNEVQHR